MFGYGPVRGKITSGFGWRTDPMHGKKRFHRGIDIGASRGTPVYSTQPGIVVFSGVYSGYGNVVVVYHGDDVFTLFGHLERQYVQKGQRVNGGQLLAAVGSSGRATGPHLHFEVHQHKKYVDPVRYLSFIQNWDAMREAPVRATKHKAAKKTTKKDPIINVLATKNEKKNGLRHTKHMQVEMISGDTVERIDVDYD